MTALIALRQVTRAKTPTIAHYLIAFEHGQPRSENHIILHDDAKPASEKEEIRALASKKPEYDALPARKWP